MRYRKKPVVVEAIRCADAIYYAQSDWHRLPNWLQGAYYANLILFVDGVTGARILAHEAWVTAAPSDWIIRGVEGEIYPCDAKVFSQTYEPVP
jgi:hypothetical protein